MERCNEWAVKVVLNGNWTHQATIADENKQNQETKKDDKKMCNRQYVDHGQQTQQTMARRRRAVAAPTVTPMATVSLVEKRNQIQLSSDSVQSP